MIALRIPLPVAFLILLAAASSAFAQPRPRNLVPRQAQQAGNVPWDNDLVIATSADGVTFGEAKVFVERGGVAHVARDAKGRLIATFQWFPLDRAEAFDRVAARVSADDGKTWSEPRSITVRNLPEGYARPFDPTLLPLADGRLRLYFTSHPRGQGGEGGRGGTPAIHSALSADGDPYTYDFEPGARLAVAGERVIDCAAVQLGATIHLYAPRQDDSGRGYHATSRDGLAFERQADVRLPGDEGDGAEQADGRGDGARDAGPRRSWLGCAVTIKDGRAIRFYGSGGRGGWSATSADGVTWTMDEGPPRAGADPGVAPLGGGGWVMVATGRRRADAGRGRPLIPMKKPAPSGGEGAGGR